MTRLLAEFAKEEALVAAVDRLRAQGFDPLESFTPHPVPALDERLGGRPSRLPVVILAAGLAGAAVGFAMELYAAAVAYPINIGGRPLNSWPAFVPISFEIGVLSAVIAGFFGYLVANRLPALHVPGLDDGLLAAASRDGYLLMIGTDQPARLRHALMALDAVRIAELEP